MISNPDAIEVSLQMRAERRLIGSASHRHIEFHVRVGAAPSGTRRARPPVAIALVLDRSGSMHGDKIDTARRAALAVLDRLEETDHIAAVIFDDQIDVLQHGAPATAEVKARLRAELGAVQARGNTALHEGWLTGCRAIAQEQAGTMLARCFLLTDGLANAGLTDAEQIASEAAAVREHAGVGTSTFGIGNDYDESLLGPMAVAGGGQFHNLRTHEEIARTFLGELGELLTVAASNVRLEIHATRGTSAEVVSAFWSNETHTAQWSVALGDLIACEERHVIVRFGFSPRSAAPQMVRARLVWVDASGTEAHGAWQEIAFEPADREARSAEQADPQVLHFVGQHHAERARRTAVLHSRRGDIEGARRALYGVARRIAEYAGTDGKLREALAELNTAARDLEQHGYQAAQGKEAYFVSQSRARGQRDLRQP
jgi:Ca-activated chloride channel homolog